MGGRGVWLGECQVRCQCHVTRACDTFGLYGRGRVQCQEVLPLPDLTVVGWIGQKLRSSSDGGLDV